MAHDTQLDIKPLIVETFYDKVMQCNFPWNPQPIKMRVLDNVPIANVKTKEDIQNLCKQCQDIMSKALDDINSKNKKE